MVAFAGYAPEPGGAISLTPPLILTHTASDLIPAIVGLITDAVVAEPGVRGGGSVRCLTDDSVTAPVFQALLASGFQVAATIGCYVAELTSAPVAGQRGGDPFGIRILSHQQIRTEQTQLAQAADAINASSEDLTGLPKPPGDELVRQWSDQSARIIQAECDAQVVGLLVATGCDTVSTRAGGVTLEFLGVVPEWRRRGVASSLLKVLVEGLGESLTDGALPVEICVFVDEANAPALSWYRHSGFRQQSLANLLTRVADQQGLALDPLCGQC